MPVILDGIEDTFFNLNSTDPYTRNIPLQSYFESDADSSIILSLKTTDRTTWISSSFVNYESTFGYENFYMLGIYVSNGYAYVGDNDRGHLIYNVTDPLNPRLIVEISASGCLSGGCPVTGFDDIVIFGAFDLYIYETVNKTDPVLVSTFTETVFAGDLTLNSANDRLTCCDNEDLFFIDISTISNPETICKISEDQVEGGVVVDDVAYIATFYEFKVYDISNQEPVCFPDLTFMEDTSYGDQILVFEDFLYFNFETKVSVYNISNPTHPVFTQQTSMVVSPWLIQRDEYLFGFYSDISSNEFRIYDLSSNPSDPSIYSSVELPYGYYCPGISLDDDFAYLVCEKRGMIIIDISDTSSPSLLWRQTEDIWFAVQVHVDEQGEYLYVLDYYNGLRIMDIHTNPDGSPVLLGGYEPEDVFTSSFYYCERFVIDEEKNLCYVIMDSRLKILNISDKSNPTFLGQSDSFNSGRQLVVKDNIAYVANYGLRIYNVSNPTNPEFIIEHYSNEYVQSAWGIAITSENEEEEEEANNIVFVTEYTYKTLRILDFSSDDWANPTLLAVYDGLENKATNLLYDEDRQILYVGDNYLGVQILEVSDKTNPKLLSKFDTARFEYGNMFLVDDILVLGDMYDDILIYDVSNASNPTRVGQIRPTNSALGSLRYVELAGSNRFYAAYETNGVQIIEFGDLDIFGDIPTDFSCGSVPITVRASDEGGHVDQFFNIIFDDTCTEHGYCVDDENRCECDISPYGGEYYGNTCEEWDCFGTPNGVLLVCSGNGECASPNECVCNTTHFGQECEFLVFYCFNISAFYDDPNLICGGHGACQNQDNCVCDAGYFSVIPGSECTEYFCGKYEWNDEVNVCSGRGICVDSQNCECDETYEGDFCESWSCYFEKMDDKQLVCSGNGECESPNECVCHTNYIGDKCETNKLYYSVMTPILSIFFSLSIVIAILISVIVLCCCYVLILVCFVLIIGGGIVLIFTAIKQRFGIKKFARLKNVNLLLQEQELEDDTSVAHLRIDRSLFEIPFDEIEVKKVVGSGGSLSIVFLAVWQGRDVAFKCFKTRTLFGSQDSFDIFEKEVKVTASLSHPNVIQFFGATLKPPRIGIIMEFCHNGEILHFLKKYREKNENKCYPIDEKIRLIGEICSSMRYLHSRNIIHRDLKCENILVDSQEHTKLMDFGLSKIVKIMSVSKTSRIGTSQYMAPEITSGADYSEKCDVFSFGILVWVIFTEDSQAYGINAGSESNIDFKVMNNPYFRPSISVVERHLKTDYYNNSLQELFIEEEILEKKMDWIWELMIPSWNHKPEDRMSFSEILETFFDDQLREKNHSDIEKNRKQGEKKKKLDENIFFLKKKERVKELGEKVLLLEREREKYDENLVDLRKKLIVLQEKKNNML